MNIQQPEKYTKGVDLNQTSNFDLSFNTDTNLLQLSPQNVQQIHLHFFDLYFTRKTALLKVERKTRSPQPVSQTYKPVISKKSARLADQSFRKIKKESKSPLTRREALELKASESIEKLRVKEKEREESHPFRPDIGNKSNKKRDLEKSSVFSFLYSDSKGKKMRQDRSKNDIEYEKQMKELTFAPNIHASPRKETKKLKPMFEMKKRGQPTQFKQPKYIIGISLGGKKQEIKVYEHSDIN